MLSKIKLHNLERLHRSMKALNITQQKFNYKVDKRANFEIIFSIRSSPYVLALTEKNNSLFIKYDVQRGYLVESGLESEVYRNLAALLKTEGQSFTPFNPWTFLQELDSKIPTLAEVTRKPMAADIARIRKDLPESDKPYFVTWRRNDLQGARVSEKNLEKTREILGIEAFEFSQCQNVSSCWTADLHLARNWKKKI